MRPQSFSKDFLLGALTIMLFFFAVGAVNTDTGNTAGSDTESYRSLACSNDGLTVYVLDDEQVYRSTDGGQNWRVVLRKPSKAP